MIGKRLKEIRELRGFSQEYLASKIKKTVRTISNYENEINSAPDQVLVEICKTLQISSDYLLGLTDSIDSTFDDSEKLDYEDLYLLELIKQRLKK